MNETTRDKISWCKIVFSPNYQDIHNNYSCKHVYSHFRLDLCNETVLLRVGHAYAGGAVLALGHDKPCDA